MSCLRSLQDLVGLRSAVAKATSHKHKTHPKISSRTSAISLARDGLAPSHLSDLGQRVLRGQMMRAGYDNASSIQEMLRTLATALSFCVAALGMRASPRRCR